MEGDGVSGREGRERQGKQRRQERRGSLGKRSGGGEEEKVGFGGERPSEEG